MLTLTEAEPVANEVSDHPPRSIKLRWANGLQKRITKTHGNHLRLCQRCRQDMAEMVEETFDVFNKRLMAKRM